VVSDISNLINKKEKRSFNCAQKLTKEVFCLKKKFNQEKIEQIQIKQHLSNATILKNKIIYDFE